MNRIPLVVGSIIGIPLLVFLALGFRHNPDVIPSPLIGKPAPDFRLSSFAGETVDIEALRGQPAVLNFWASWCRPCVIEHPLLTAAAREYAGRVHFVGVVPPEDTAEAVDRFTARFGAWGPTFHDQDGRVSIAYGVFKLPETYFLDRDGNIVYKHAGPLDPETIQTTLEPLL